MKRKKKRKSIKRIFDFKMVYKMIIVYIIGGFIPLIFMCLYTNSKSGKILLESKKSAHIEDVSMITDSLKESMSAMTNTARTLSFDKRIKRIAEKDYSKKKEKGRFEKDCRKMSDISDYLDFYKNDIGDIDIYLLNKTVSYFEYEESEWFSFVDNSVKNTYWYSETVDDKTEDSSGFWYFSSEPYSDVSMIQLSRTIRNRNGEILGVVKVTMQPQHLYDIIDSRDTDTMILYMNKNTVYSNFYNTEKYDFLMNEFPEHSNSVTSKKITHSVEDYQMTFSSVSDQVGKRIFEIVNIERYNVMLSKINRMTLSTFFPAFIGILISFILITVTALIFDHRITLLRIQMQRAAKGEYDRIVPIKGRDEIADIYRELDTMIREIGRLNQKIVDEQVQKEKMHTRQKEAEFKMLTSQINPHFLYNTLETIRMKAIIDHEKEIQELVMMLGKIMRYSIQAGTSPVSLKDELKVTGYYLKIQAYRFGDRIVSDIKVDDDVDTSVQVMPLIIQPFVENCFSHGLESLDEGGCLTVHVSEDNGNIRIGIRDNGEGMDPVTLGNLRRKMNDFKNNDPGHIGVTNVNQRIKMKYGNEYGVEVESSKGKGTAVTIVIPAGT